MRSKNVGQGRPNPKKYDKTPAKMGKKISSRSSKMRGKHASPSSYATKGLKKLKPKRKGR